MRKAAYEPHLPPDKATVQNKFYFTMSSFIEVSRRTPIEINGGSGLSLDCYIHTNKDQECGISFWSIFLYCLTWIRYWCIFLVTALALVWYWIVSWILLEVLKLSFNNKNLTLQMTLKAQGTHSILRSCSEFAEPAMTNSGFQLVHKICWVFKWNLKSPVKRTKSQLVKIDLELFNKIYFLKEAKK